MSTNDARSPLDITSAANPRVKQLVDLRRRRARAAQRLTVVEGRDELALALESGVTPEAIYYAPDLVRDPLPVDALEAARERGTSLVSLSEAAFGKASYRESPDGWLAVVATPDRDLDALDPGGDALVLVCEGVEKPGNLGAMLRTADAAGVDAVVASTPVADWGNPNVIRASKGTVFALPVAAAPTPDVIAWTRQRGLRAVVATPDADHLVSEVDLTVPTAIVVGAEHAGVSQEWRAAADATARLPMAGRVNSLNVAISAAVAVYEAVRQRGLKSAGHGLHRRDADQ